MPPGFLAAAASVLGSVILAGALVFTFRWELGATSKEVYRLDRWTGTVVQCGAASLPRARADLLGFPLEFSCTGLPTPGELLGPAPPAK